MLYHIVQVLKYHKHTHGVVMGGANRRAEAERLVKGVRPLPPSLPIYIYICI